MKHLVNQYYLGTDKYNYILYERKIKTKGKYEGSEFFEEIGFFGQKLSTLFKRLIDLYIHENLENKSYEQLLEFCKEVVELQEKVLKKED